MPVVADGSSGLLVRHGERQVDEVHFAFFYLTAHGKILGGGPVVIGQNGHLVFQGVAVLIQIARCLSTMAWGIRSPK